jgi:hypothetical protein
VPYFQPTILQFAPLDESYTDSGPLIDVSCDVTAASITGETPTEKRATLCGSHTVVGETANTLAITGDQYYDHAARLARFLDEHHGELARFVLAWPGQSRTSSGVVRVVRGDFGGEAGAIAEFDIELGLEGDVTTTYAPVELPNKGAVAAGDAFPADPNVTASDATNAAKLSTLGYTAATPTAWTAGQGFTIGGYEFSWNGTTWAPGTATAEDEAAA